MLRGLLHCSVPRRSRSMPMLMLMLLPFCPIIRGGQERWVRRRWVKRGEREQHFERKQILPFFLLPTLWFWTERRVCAL